MIAVFIATISSAKAQNVQLHYDFEREAYTSTVEMFKTDDWGSTFFFIDFDYAGTDGEMNLGYFEIARALKLGSLPFEAHVEYNGGLTNGFSLGNSYLLGLEKTWLAKDFSKGLTLIGAYKNITGTERDNFQVTAVWFMNFLDNKLSFTGFADFWREEHSVWDSKGVESTSDYIFLAEPQIWYNVTKNFSAGGELELSNDFGGDAGFKARPTLAVKWNF